MSNLVMHAQRELEILGEEPWITEHYLDVIRVFSEQGHSGGSASVFIPTLSALLRFENLTPLTDDPEEWMEIGRDTWSDATVWQSRRNAGAFSHDGGKTYYLLDEGAHAKNRRPLHKSRDHTVPYQEWRDAQPEIEELPKPDPDMQVKIAEAYLDLKVWAQKMVSTLKQHRMADRPEDTLLRAYSLVEELEKVWEAENAGPA